MVLLHSHQQAREIQLHFIIFQVSYPNYGATLLATSSPLPANQSSTLKYKPEKFS